MPFSLSKRSAPPTGESAGPVLISRDPRWPALLEMLIAEKYPDGSRRLPSSVTLFFHASGLKACLNDKDVGLTAWVSAGSIMGLLDALEAGLQEDRLDWRADGKRTQKKR